MSDLLRMDHINSLPQPFIARTWGGGNWPVHDIEVQTGLLRLDVCGKLDVMHIRDVRFFRDDAGVEHDSDSFYTETCEGDTLADISSGEQLGAELRGMVGEKL